MASIVLGGFLYFLNIQFSYKQQGIVFFHNGLSVNFIFLIIFSPIIIYIYIKQGLNLKNNYSKYHHVKLYFNNKQVEYIGFVDTGNKVVDPYFKRRVIFVDNLDDKLLGSYVLVPIKTLNMDGLVKCFRLNKLEIDGKEVREKFLVGIMDKNITIDGIDCILPEI